MAEGGNSDLGTLMIHVGIDGDVQAVAGLENVKQAIPAVGSAAKGATADLAGLSSTLKSVGVGFALFAGVNAAARAETYGVALKRLLGTAQAAGAILSQIRDYSIISGDDVGELRSYAVQLAAVGYGASRILPIVKALSDLQAGTNIPGISSGALSLISRLRQWEGIPSGMMLRPLLRGTIPGMMEMLKQVGVTMSGNGMNASLVRGGRVLTGPQIADAIVQAIERKHGGAAETPTYVRLGAGIMNAFNSIMGPTGALLLKSIEPLMKLIRSIVAFASDANKWSLGVLGLGIAGLYLSRSIPAAVRWVSALSVAIQRLGAAARNAAGSSIVSPGGSRGSRIAKWGTGAAFGAGTALEYAGDKIGGKTGDWASTIGSGMQMGALAAMIIPNIYGKIGAIVAGILAAVGLKLYGDHNAEKSTADGTGDKLDKTNSILQQMLDLHVYGGGPMGGRIKSNLQFEIAAARLAATGYD